MNQKTMLRSHEMTTTELTTTSNAGPLADSADSDGTTSATTAAFPSVREPKPRLLLIIPTLDACGAEKQLALLATSDALRRQFDLHICVLTRTGPYEETLRQAHLPIHFIWKKYKIDLGAFCRLRRLIRALRPAIVHTWIFAANAYGRLAAWLEKTPVIVGGERCVDPWKAGYELVIDRFLAKRSKAILANSSGVVDFYVQQKIPAELFHVIPNGIENTPFVFSEQDAVQKNAVHEMITTTATDAIHAVDRTDFFGKTNGVKPLHTEEKKPRSDTDKSGADKRRGMAKVALCDSLGIPATSRLVLLVARLWPQKRIRDAIWAADLLKVVRDDVHLLLIGDGPEKESLEMFRYECRIEDRVHFLGNRRDVPKLLAMGDLLWLPSAFEGLPNAILEAMAAGLPVVATDIPGNRDLVRHGQTGFLVPTGEVAPLSMKVNKTVARGLAKFTLNLLESPSLATTLGQNARRIVETEYTVARMVESHILLYQKLLLEAVCKPNVEFH